MLRKHLRPAFGALRLRDITTQAIDDFKKESAAPSPKTVANQLTLLATIAKAGSRGVGLAALGPARAKAEARPRRRGRRTVTQDAGRD
jgi:hypothetical protein